MKQQLVGLSLGALLLLGAGCTTENSDMNIPSNNESVSNMEIKDTTSSTVPATPENTDFTLKATALGNRSVQFTWDFPDGLPGNPPALRLVRSQTENPTFPPNFWYQVNGDKDGTVWLRLPTGEQHFRICIFENDKCGLYSNNVKVDVK